MMSRHDIATASSPDGAPSALTGEIGREVMGPVVHRWMLALHQHICQLDDGDTAFLFCARAGLRLKRLYELFLDGQPQAHRATLDMFWISRVSICKGTFSRQPDLASDLFAREYHRENMADLVRGLLRHQPDRLRGLPLADLPAGGGFPSWIGTNAPAAKALRSYLRDCGGAMDDYLSKVTRGCKRVVLIDSGWQGTAQSLLARAYPDTTWMGLYFGRMLGPHHDPRITSDVVGLMFERNTFDPSVPASAVTAHHHVIETLLEPNGPSIEDLPAGDFAATAQGLIEANLAAGTDAIQDALWLEVEQYITTHAVLPLDQVMTRAQPAVQELSRLLITPTRHEALALVGKDRSADFGKSLEVPVLVNPADPALPTLADRMAEALWKPGQMALEQDGPQARDAQLRSVGQDPDKASQPEDDPLATPTDGPLVAIITRTKNRPVLLKRAAESVAAQSYRNYLWVVVNDGGDRADVEEVIQACGVDPRLVRLVSNAESLGMEAASNAGINAVDSDMIVIHDDDDSWAPDFLSKTVGYLVSPAGQRYGGVITKSVYVSEEILGDEVVIHNQRPYQDWVRNVEFAEMACGNFFPPIAFLFRRAIYDMVAGYNESLPVLGDWCFNLEFLLHADIGMVHEPLAYYHHRDRETGKSGLYANSVIGGHSKHVEFAAVVRNELLRRHSNNNVAALALAMGYMNADTRGRLNNLTTGGGGRGAAHQVAGGEDGERLFLLAQANYELARRPLHGLVRRAKPLPSDASWPEITDLFKRLRVPMPVPDSFDEVGYLARNEDVARAVAKGDQPSGFEHYARHGRAEGRPRADD
mgnify:CR=1 FL=1